MVPPSGTPNQRLTRLIPTTAFCQPDTPHHPHGSHPLLPVHKEGNKRQKRANSLCFSSCHSYDLKRTDCKVSMFQDALWKEHCEPAPCSRPQALRGNSDKLRCCSRGSSPQSQHASLQITTREKLCKGIPASSQVQAYLQREGQCELRLHVSTRGQHDLVRAQDALGALHGNKVQQRVNSPEATSHIPSQPYLLHTRKRCQGLPQRSERMGLTLYFCEILMR